MATTNINHIVFDLSGVYDRPAQPITPAKPAQEQEQEQEQEAAKMVKKPANRCSHTDCRVKLMLTDMACKCESRFCSMHRMPESHKCTFDFKAAARVILEKNLVKVSASCLERL